jgi:hypothetical protein
MSVLKLPAGTKVMLTLCAGNIEIELGEVTNVQTTKTGCGCFYDIAGPRLEGHVNVQTQECLGSSRKMHD